MNYRTPNPALFFLRSRYMKAVDFPEFPPREKDAAKDFLRDLLKDFPDCFSYPIFVYLRM